MLQNKAALAGVSPRDIVATMRMGLAGDYVTPIHSGEAKYEIPVRLTLPPERQSNLDELLKLDSALVGRRTGPAVGTDPGDTRGEREKTVYHKDLLPVDLRVRRHGGQARQSAVRHVRHPLADWPACPSEQGGVLGERFISQPDDRYRQYTLKWDGEWQVTYETFRDMGIAYGVGLIMIYLLVVAQFKSYLTPLVIMAPIPLTIIGVMPGHAMLGAQFTATSMIGMIALAGIIVRNSILLVDFINLQIAEGASELEQAVVNAASARAKPIVLTGLAAMLGAFFILDDPIFNGLAVSLIFGILVSTLLTLVVIPVLYYAAIRRRPAQPAVGREDSAPM